MTVQRACRQAGQQPLDSASNLYRPPSSVSITMSDAAYVSIDDRFNQLRLSESNPGSHGGGEAGGREATVSAVQPPQHCPRPLPPAPFIPAYQPPHSYALSNAEYKDPSASSSSSSFPPSLLPNPTALPLAVYVAAVRWRRPGGPRRRWVSPWRSSAGSASPTRCQAAPRRCRR